MESISTLNELELETVKLKAAARVFRATNHELRLKILNFIHENKRVDVSSIYKKLGLEQSVASSHLGILRKVGIVTTLRDKRFVYYSVNYKRLEELHQVSEKLLRF